MQNGCPIASEAIAAITSCTETDPTNPQGGEQARAKLDDLFKKS